METPAEREQRIRRLETQRASRHAAGDGVPASVGTVWPTPDDAGTGVIPLEVGPGRGNLNYSSGFVPTFPTALALIGGRTMSFARIFQSQPWVGAAVMRMLTWSVRVPLKVYRKLDTNGSRVRLYPGDHPLASAVVNPWDRGSMAQLIMSLLGPVLVHGNSVTDVASGASDRIQFTPKDWRFSRPLMPWRDSVEGFVFDVDMPSVSYERSIDEVLHIAWWSPIGPIGTSPLQQLGVTIDVEDAAQRYQRALFLNGARPPGAVTTSDEFLGLERDERMAILAQLRTDITEIYSSPENQGRPALLPPGLDWKPIANGTAVEAALIEQRKLAREEVCGVFLIPPPMLGILDKATFSNIDTQRDMVYTDCLGPPLVLIEQYINSQIVSNLLQETDVYCEFDFGGVLRGDRLQEIQAIREAISTAVMTPNEGRDVLNQPRDQNPAMDEFYMPTNNLQPIGSPPRPGQVVVPPTSAPEEVTPSSRSKRLYVRSRDYDFEEVFS